MPLATAFAGGISTSKFERFFNPKKIKDGGSVRLTFLGDDSVAGWEVWIDGPDGKGKCIVFASEPDTTDLSTRADEEGGKVRPDSLDKAKKMFYFWIWNYETERVELLQFNQKQIAEKLDLYFQDEEVQAEPHLFDFVIHKTSTGPAARDVKYDVTSLAGRRNKGNYNAQIEEAWKAHTGNLRAIFTGGDPFKG